MKKSIFMVLAMVFGFSFSPSSAQTCSDSSTPYIEVRGVASTTLAPNKIEVNITLSESDSKGKFKLSELESNLAQSLKQAGVDASKQLVITGQSSAAEKRNGAFQYKSYILTLTSAQQVDAIFDAFSQNGVLNARMGKVSNDQRSVVEAKVKVEAILNAKNSASLLASALGQKIGVAILVQDFSSSASMFDGGEVTMLRVNKASSEASLPTNLQIRPIVIEQSISVRFELLK